MILYKLLTERSKLKYATLGALLGAGAYLGKKTYDSLNSEPEDLNVDNNEININDKKIEIKNTIEKLKEKLKPYENNVNALKDTLKNNIHQTALSGLIGGASAYALSSIADKLKNKNKEKEGSSK